MNFHPARFATEKQFARCLPPVIYRALLIGQS